MGEAKRRGTYEQRVAEGEVKRAERERLQLEAYRVRREIGMRQGKSRVPALLVVAALVALTATPTAPKG